MWPSVEKGMVQALKGLKVMRQRRARAWSPDISDKLKKMTARLKAMRTCGRGP